MTNDKTKIIPAPNLNLEEVCSFERAYRRTPRLRRCEYPIECSQQRAIYGEIVCLKYAKWK